MPDRFSFSKITLDKFISFLSDNIKYIFFFYVLAQCALLFRFPVQYVSDSAYYWKLAHDCINAHGFYPLSQQIFDDLIIAPLYVNVIILLLKIYNSTLSIGLYNIILNSLQLLILFKIVNSLFNKKTAVIASLLYMLSLNNLGMVAVNITELSYTTLLLLSIYFYIKVGRLNLLAAGLICGASIAVRPLGWALFASYIITLLITRPKGKLICNLSCVTLGLAAFIIVFGSLMKLSSGYFIYTSSTGPINMLMSANDNASGGFFPIQSDYKGGPGYIPGGDTLTFRQKHDIMAGRAVSWVKDHPVKWFSLIPIKILLLFRWDDISVSRILSPDFNYQTFLKLIKHDPTVTQKYPVSFLAFWALLLALHHLFYFAGLTFFIYGLIKFRKEIYMNSFLQMLLIYSVIGIAMTMVADADVRFKYPYMFALFICNAFFITEYLKLITGRASNPPVQM